MSHRFSSKVAVKGEMSRRTSGPGVETSTSATADTKPERNSVAVQFRVHMKTDATLLTYPFETNGNQNRLYLVGSEPILGQWNPSQAIPMIRLDQQSGNKEVGVTWSADVVISVPREIHYRYFIGRRSPKFDDRVIIIKWEAFLTPRSHHINKPTKAEEKSGFTAIHDTFGQTGTHASTDGGWLTTQIELRLSFLKNPIRWWKKRHQALEYCMKVTATDPKEAGETVTGSDSVTSLNDHAMLHEEHEGTLGPVTYAILSEAKDSTSHHQIQASKPKGYQLQGLFGVPVSADENLIFRVQAEEPENLYFTIDFFSTNHPKASENSPFFAGSCHILYTNFESEDNFITAPIFGRYSRPIGAVTFKYLVIRPLQNMYLSMARSRFYHYSAAHGPMIIGHRGMGGSYGKHWETQKTRENTLESFEEAMDYGADMVEIDVQLTKDGIPILYHDFNMKVNLRKRVMDNMNDEKDANFELKQISVKDLTLKQLQSLQTYHSSVEEFGPRDWRTDPTAANADELEKSLPFPTLEKVLRLLDPKLGIVLEVKYPQFIDRGDGNVEHESIHFYARNDYLDVILGTLLEHGGERRIILCCFDSDACIMLKKKQCIFPVIFLTQGQTKEYPPYKDFRTLSIPAAIKFARAEQLIGISVHSEDLLRDSSLIADVKHAGLALFCWGADNTKLDNVEYFKGQGVDGIICDRINELVGPEEAAAKAAAKASGALKHLHSETTQRLTQRLRPSTANSGPPSGKTSGKTSVAKSSVGKAANANFAESLQVTDSRVSARSRVSGYTRGTLCPTSVHKPSVLQTQDSPRPTLRSTSVRLTAERERNIEGTAGLRHIKPKVDAC